MWDHIGVCLCPRPWTYRNEAYKIAIFQHGIRRLADDDENYINLHAKRHDCRGENAELIPVHFKTLHASFAG